MIDFAIDTEFKNIIPPLSNDEYEGLKALIQEAGRARDTLKVWHGILLDGHNRYGICLELGLPYATEEVFGIESRNDAILWIIRNQHGRRNLSLLDRALLAAKEQDILAVEAAKAKSEAAIASNKARAAASGENEECPVLPVLVKPDLDEQPRDALREAATKFGVGHETLRQVRILSEEAPDRIDAIRDGRSTVNKEFKEHNTEKKLRNLERRHAEAVAATPRGERTALISDIHELAASGKKFGCIYSDPPWVYNNQGTRAATSNHYSGLSVAELCALPVRQLAADDAHLHLWTTNAFLRQSFDIIDAWGFEFRSTFIWDKVLMGIGNYWRNSHEIMLTAVRGDAKRFNEHNMPSLFSCKRSDHSAKPEQVRSMIERASPGPYFEMFGRRVAQGWTVWGNQIDRQDLFASGAAAG